MNHRLFVAKQVIAQSRILFQSLTDAGDVSVSKDSQAAAEELVAVSVPLGELGIKKCNRRLRRS
jgi:hypothetical protein